MKQNRSPHGLGIEQIYENFKNRLGYVKCHSDVCPLRHLSLLRLSYDYIKIQHP